MPHSASQVPATSAGVDVDPRTAVVDILSQLAAALDTCATTEGIANGGGNANTPKGTNGGAKGKRGSNGHRSYVTRAREMVRKALALSAGDDDDHTAARKDSSNGGEEGLSTVDVVAQQREALRAIFVSMPDEVMSIAPMAAPIAAFEALLKAELRFKKVVDPFTLIPGDAVGDVGINLPLRDQLLARRVAVWQGDMAAIACDAVVNPANGALLGCFLPSHRCLDNVLHCAAGPRLRLACRALVDRLGSDEGACLCDCTGQEEKRKEEEIAQNEEGSGRNGSVCTLIVEDAAAPLPSSSSPLLTHSSLPLSACGQFRFRCACRCGCSAAAGSEGDNSCQCRWTPDPNFGREAAWDANGQCRVTSAFCLPSRFVFHTVGPDLSSGDGGGGGGGWGRRAREPRAPTPTDVAELRSCYRRCLETAIAMGLRSIAFCCISTGIFSFPADKAAALAVEEVLSVLLEEAARRRRRGGGCAGEEGLEKEEAGAAAAIVEGLPLVVFNVFRDEDLALYRALLPAA